MNININNHEIWMKVALREAEKAFNEKAVEICAAKGSFDILEKMTLVVEVGETSAFPKKGLTAGIRLGIRGIVECK